MSGHSYTPTRELASAAAQKASDAYAMARRVDSQMAGVMAKIDALMAEIEELRSYRVTPARKAPR